MSFFLVADGDNYRAGGLEVQTNLTLEYFASFCLAF